MRELTLGRVLLYAVIAGIVAGLLVTLVDVPLIDARLVAALVDTWIGSRAPLVRPARAGRHGHPVLVSRAVADALLSADGSLSARTVLERFSAAAVDVPVEDEGAFLDIDTPEDYDRVLARWSADSGGLLGPS